MGDVNDDLLAKGNNLNKVIKDLNLKQIINKPTRITQTSSTLLDVIISNSSHIMIESDVTPSSIAN